MDADYNAISLVNDPTPNVILKPFSGSQNGSFERCGNGARQQMRFQPNFSRLRFVRNVNVDGVAHPAYEITATGPLFVFRMEDNAVMNGRHYFPLDMGRTSEVSAPASPVGTMYWAIQYAVISRGGYMTSVPRVSLGAVTTSLVNHSLPGLRQNLVLEIGVRSAPCTIRNVDIVLDDLPLGSLISGSSSGEKPLGLRMNCPMDGTRAYLTVTDSVMVGNTGDRLANTADSTARGVAIQLLHRGSPVVMMQNVDIGMMTRGDHVLPITARYLRTTSSVMPGTVKAQAVITATYL